MRKMSLKPAVVTRTVFSPFLSSRALVATVVPILIHLICEVSTLSLGIFFPVTCHSCIHSFINSFQVRMHRGRAGTKSIIPTAKNHLGGGGNLFEYAADAFTWSIFVIVWIHREQLVHSEAWLPWHLHSSSSRADQRKRRRKPVG